MLTVAKETVLTKPTIVYKSLLGLIIGFIKMNDVKFIWMKDIGGLENLANLKNYVTVMV